MGLAKLKSGFKMKEAKAETKKPNYNYRLSSYRRSFQPPKNKANKLKSS
jgi:hypothetical protein